MNDHNQDDREWQQAERERAIKMAISELRQHGGTRADVAQMIALLRKAAKDDEDHQLGSGRMDVPE